MTFYCYKFAKIPIFSSIPAFLKQRINHYTESFNHPQRLTIKLTNVVSKHLTFSTVSFTFYFAQILTILSTPSVSLPTLVEPRCKVDKSFNEIQYKGRYTWCLCSVRGSFLGCGVEGTKPASDKRLILLTTSAEKGWNDYFYFLKDAAHFILNCS